MRYPFLSCLMLAGLLAGCTRCDPVPPTAVGGGSEARSPDAGRAAPEAVDATPGNPPGASPDASPAPPSSPPGPEIQVPAAGAAPLAGQSLVTLLAGTARVQIVETTLVAGGAPTSRSVQVLDRPSVEALVQAVGPLQALSAASPRCLFGHALTFQDPAGHALGTVGLCRGFAPEPGMAAAFLAPARPGEAAGTPARHGLIIPDGQRLFELMEQAF